MLLLSMPPRGLALRTPQGLRSEATLLSPAGEFVGTAGKDHPLTYLGESSLTRGQYLVYSAGFGSWARSFALT